MKNVTDELSFLVKPSKVPGAGVGVFATHDIAAGTKLDLWTKDEVDRFLDEKDVPPAFQSFCIAQENGKLHCPGAFNRMCICWYLNHSDKPNAKCGEDLVYVAIRDIREGEEILIDYNDLNEPEDKKESYYKK